MSGILLAGDLEAEVEDPTLDVVNTEPPTSVGVLGPPELDVDVQVPDPGEISMEPVTTDVLVLPVAGPEGPAGATVFEPFEYQMPVAQTTAVIDHTLGHDPVAIQVMVNDVQASEFEVVFTIPQQQIRVAFDIPVAALIRLF